MTPDRPWLDTDPFPPVPELGTYGFFQGEKPKVAEDTTILNEMLARRKADNVAIGWTPADTRARPLYLIPLYHDAWIANQRTRIRESAILGWIFIALIPFSLLGVDSIREIWGPIFMICALGILPVVSARWSRRELDEDIAEGFQTRYADDLFDYWLAQRPARLGTVLAAGLVVLFLLPIFLPLFRDGTSYLELAMLDRPGLRDGEWWRALTVATVHGGIYHILMNAGAAWGLALLLERLTHRGTVAIVYLTAVIAGSLGSAYLNRDGVAVGASGGIMGLAGLLVAYTTRYRAVIPHRLRKSAIQILVLTGAMGVLAWGLIDNAAHAAGALAGWGLGQWIPLPAPAETPEDRPWLVRLGAVAIGVVLFSWGLTAWLAWPR